MQKVALLVEDIEVTELESSKLLVFCKSLSAAGELNLVREMTRRKITSQVFSVLIVINLQTRAASNLVSGPEIDASTELKQFQAFRYDFCRNNRTEQPFHRSLWLHVLERDGMQLLIAVVPMAEIYPTYTPPSLCSRENSLAAG